MPGKEEIFAALKMWRQFLTDPAGALAHCSLALNGPLTGGVCTVEGAQFKARPAVASTGSVSGPSSANFQKHFKKGRDADVEDRMVFKPNTRVHQLQVNAGGNGIAYWYPYLDKGASGGTFNGVGECTIPVVAPIGTVAITGAMNGCSLRVYEDQLRGELHFYHDNNGENLEADLLEAKDFEHLISINSVNNSIKMRGGRDQNFTYWEPYFDAPMRASCYLISLKTAGDEWSFWRSVVLHQFSNEQEGLIFKSTVQKYTYWGHQQHNKLIATLKTPLRRTRSASISGTTGTPKVRGRSGSI